MPYPKTHYLRIALTFVACAISVYILCFVVFDSAANFVNEIFEPRGSLGALCIALLLALFNPDSTGKTSQIGKFVWGLSICHVFIFLVCMSAVFFTQSQNVNVLASIVTYSVCGYLFSLSIFFKGFSYLAIFEKLDPLFLFRSVFLTCFIGLLAALIYPLVIYNTLNQETGYLAFQPFVLAKEIQLDLYPNLLLLIDCVIPFCFFHFFIRFSSGSLFVGGRWQNSLLVYLVMLTGVSNLYLIQLANTSNSIEEYVQKNLGNGITLMYAYLIVFVIIHFPKKFSAHFSYKNLVFYSSGSLILGLIAFYSFKEAIPSSTLFLPFLGVISIAMFLRQINKLEDQISIRTKEINEERKKTDKLLSNILPRYVINELKEKGYSKPRQLKNIAVMFTDFVGFTQISQQISANELISELNDIFTAFDGIASQNSSERIKTIGDAYMCVSGLDKSQISPQVNLINVAKEMIVFLEERNNRSDTTWKIRIGIASGDSVGGIVGKSKYLFDLFGDAVNTAARMESYSEPQRVNIDEPTFKKVKDTFQFTKREMTFVKGKGEMQMYFLD